MKSRTAPSSPSVFPITAAIATIGLIAALSSGLVPSNAVAAFPGDLDLTFGTDGATATDIWDNNESGRAMALQADGKIVVAGTGTHTGPGSGIHVVRYDADGILDPTFGTGGVVVISNGTTSRGAEGVAIQTDGKIVIAGRSTTSPNPAAFGLVRLNSSGSIDTTFDGDGFVETLIPNASFAAANAVVLQADGKIVSAGYATGLPGRDIVITRHNTNGSLDTTFDGDGISIKGALQTQGVPLLESDDDANAVAMQPDGKIIVAGGYSDPNVSGRWIMSVWRLLPDGSRDTSFGPDGDAGATWGSTWDEAFAVAVQPDGKIIAAGTTDTAGGDTHGAIARWTSNGSPDSFFGTNGMTELFLPKENGIAGIGIQPNGRIVLIGGIDSDDHSPHLMVAKLIHDGTLDTTFGDAGFAIHDLFDEKSWYSLDGALQPDGKIVAAGASSGRVAVARLVDFTQECGNGVLDTHEDCDDGNMVANDGCSLDCTLEPPLQGCVTGFDTASLLIKESAVGREKLIAKLKKPGFSLSQGDFGDPINGQTSYNLCLFDDQDEGVGVLHVNRAGELCAGKDCWKDIGLGWQYKDKLARSNGVTKLQMKGGPVGRGSIQLKAGNNANKGQTTLPLGIPAALAGSSSVKLQLVISDGVCFEVTLGNVKKQTNDFFKAVD